MSFEISPQRNLGRGAFGVALFPGVDVTPPN
jgi:hypothetical protein